MRRRYRGDLRIGAVPRHFYLAETARHIPRPVTSILDIGCNRGVVSAWAHDEFPGVPLTGIDIIPEAAAEFADLGAFRVADFHDMPFEDGAFDMTMALSVLRYNYDFERAVTEVSRVTKRWLLFEDGAADSEPGARPAEEWLAAFFQQGFGLHYFTTTLKPHFHAVLRRLS